MQHISKQEYQKLVKKTLKYHNKVVLDSLGKIQNHSKKEAQMAKDFYLELKAGKYRQVKEQYKIPLMIKGILVTTIIVDFYLKHKDGSEELVECKSFPTMTQAFRIKWRLLEALHPEYKLTLAL